MIHVVHCKQPHDVYIGRPGILGNPYTHIVGRRTRAQFVVASLDEAISKWVEYAKERMIRDEAFRKALLDCENRTVGCWCRPRHACHGDTFDMLIAWWRARGES